MSEAPGSGVRARFSIDIEDALDEETAHEYWLLYRETFGPLETLAVARQLLHEDEFLDEMRDERVMKFVARDESGGVVGISTLTNHLETVPWISPGYFVHHYPEHAARGAIFYMGFTLVHPAYRRAHILQAMIGRMVDLVVVERGVCGWDICSYNEDTVGFTAGIKRFMTNRADATIEQLDTQSYWSVMLHGSRSV